MLFTCWQHMHCARYCTLCLAPSRAQQALHGSAECGGGGGWQGWIQKQERALAAQAAERARVVGADAQQRLGAQVARRQLGQLAARVERRQVDPAGGCIADLRMQGSLSV